MRLPFRALFPCPPVCPVHGPRNAPVVLPAQPFATAAALALALFTVERSVSPRR